MTSTPNRLLSHNLRTKHSAKHDPLVVQVMVKLKKGTNFQHLFHLFYPVYAV